MKQSILYNPFYERNYGHFQNQYITKNFNSDNVIINCGKPMITATTISQEKIINKKLLLL